jgi:2-polyprenyl-3-methyl-5-hydroxy-6-metoxy-1,4-benzoquinol methylase
MSTEQTKNQWGRLAEESGMRDYMKTNWGGLDNIQANMNYFRTGKKDCHWIDYLKDEFLPQGKAGHALSLGCGIGLTERMMKEHGIEFSSFTGVDLSEQCTAEADKLGREISLAPTIKYIAANLNAYELPKQQYDFIFFNHSLHHVKSLELMLAGCAQALRPGGLMLVNEFVGPSRFQWTDEQLNIANALFKQLPEELRFDLHLKQTKHEIKRLSVAEMIQHDESEAVRSDEIDTILKRFFTMDVERGYGGTINNLVFAFIAGNFDLDNPAHKIIVDLLIQFENTLIDKKVLPSDFKFYIARPKSNANSIAAYWKLRGKLASMLGKK